MAREMLPRLDGAEPSILRGFRCGNCSWFYSRQDHQSDYWDLLADARTLFEAHDCRDYQATFEGEDLRSRDRQ